MDSPTSNKKLTDGALAALVENLHGYVDTGSLLHWQVTTALRELQDRRATGEPLPAPPPIPSDFDLASRLNVVYNRLFIDCRPCEQEEAEILYAAIGALRAAQPLLGAQASAHPTFQRFGLAPLSLTMLPDNCGMWYSAAEVDALFEARAASTKEGSHE